jgi:iron complex transport system substrate-binding protein
MAVSAILVASGVAAGPIGVTDDSGRRVELNAPARRIISLSPHATELVYDAGAGAALVGVSEASDFPEAARRLPQVGGASGIDLEQVLTLKPDLVIAWSSGNSRGQIEALERAGIAVFESDPKSIEDIATSLERLGRLAGSEVTAAARATAFRGEMQRLASEAAGKSPLRVFYQLSEGPIFTLGGPHLVSRLMEVCGARNLFADLNALAPEISSEAVVARRPDLIVTDPRQVAALSQTWQSLGAVKQDGKQRIVGIDADLLSRATPRVAEGTRELCRDLDRLRAPLP